jgi:hypothetical protein
VQAIFPNVAAGFHTVSHSLDDSLSAADQHMYENKRQMKLLGNKTTVAAPLLS